MFWLLTLRVRNLLICACWTARSVCKGITGLERLAIGKNQSVNGLKNSDLEALPVLLRI